MNSSPLYRLFQAFRRSSPQGKNGLWSRILVVRDNDRAIEMAAKFQDNDPEYLDDEKWYQLVEEQDNAVLGGATATTLVGQHPRRPRSLRDSLILRRRLRPPFLRPSRSLRSPRLSPLDGRFSS